MMRDGIMQASKLLAPAMLRTSGRMSKTCLGGSTIHTLPPRDQFNKSGIYLITNTRNGKGYIGRAVNFRLRWNLHYSQLRRGIHHSLPLQRAWGKYGEDAFSLEILEFVDRSNLKHREQHFMSVLKPEYNMVSTVSDNPRRKLTEEHKAKISAANKGRQVTEEHRANLSKATKRTQTERPELLENFKKVNIGRKLSEEHRAHLSMSSASKGKSPSAELRARWSAKNKGRKNTEEHKAKISASQKARWARWREHRTE